MDVVSEHVTLRRSGRRWVGLCPFHAEKTPSFTVNPDLGIFKCFGCGKGGDLFSFVMEREQVAFGDALRLMADRAGVRLEAESRSDLDAPGRPELLRVNAWAAQMFRRQFASAETGREAQGYVERRGIEAGCSEAFALGLSVDDVRALVDAAARAGLSQTWLLAADLLRTNDQGRVYPTFRHRLMFPIRDAGGRVVGFGGRTLGNDPAKYINTRQTFLFDKGRGLYGIDLAREPIRTRGRAVLVEGYTDCILAHQAGFSETVATLGTALTEWQVELLRRFCERVIMLFDSDAAGVAAADRAIGVALPRCLQVELARVPEGKDPADFVLLHGAERFSDVLNESIEALRFKWSSTLARFNGESSDAGRREAVESFLQTVGDVWSGGAVDAIQRGLIVNQVSRLLNLEAQEVSAQLSRRSRRPEGSAATKVGQSDCSRARVVGYSETCAGWAQVLEVVLAEPGLAAELSCFRDAPPPRDAGLQRLVDVVRRAAEELGEFRLADIFARCEERADAALAAELAERGSQSGNFESRLRVALDKIGHAAARTVLQVEKRKLLGQERSIEEERVPLALIAQQAMARRHYVVPRLTSSMNKPGGGSSEPASPDSQVVEQA